MDGWIIIKTIIDNKEFNLNYKKLRTQIKGMGKGIENFLKNSFKSGLSAAKGVLSIIGVIAKSIFKIGLAIVGITAGIALLISGALILSKAFERVFKENEQIKANLDYMKFALIKALEPAINAVANVLVKIINFLIKIMQYTAYIIHAWTGYNIFETATPEAYAKYFEEAQKSSKKTAKNAGEIKKQLAGFDEMNVLQDTTKTNTDESTGYTAPNFNLSDLNKFKAPKWLDKIIKFGKWVLKNWEDVVFGLLLIKMFFDVITGNWIWVVLDFIGLLIVGFKKIWENVKTIIDILKPYFRKFVDWLVNSVATPIGNMFVNLWNGVKNGAKTAVNNVKNFFGSIPSFFSGIGSQIGGIVNSMVQNFRNGFDTIFQKAQQTFNNVRDTINNALSGIKNKLSEIASNVGNTIINGLKTAINNVLSKIEGAINFLIDAINVIIWAVNKIPFINLGKVSRISLPRLAKGGIINMPNSGVPIGGAIAGESGKEGVIPLTDSQQMALLGEAIGKYITVNATIVNSMNGRVLNRELQKIQNQSSFATNGR